MCRRPLPDRLVVLVLLACTGWSAPGGARPLVQIGTGGTGCADYRAALHWLGGVTLPGVARDVIVRGRHVLVADQHGLEIVDTSNPARPELVGSCATPGIATQVLQYLNTAILIDAPTDTALAGLRYISIADPREPRLVGELVVPGVIRGAIVAAHRLYVAAGTAGIHEIDLRHVPPRGIQRTLSVRGAARGVAVVDRHLYVVTDAPRLLIVDRDEEEAAVVGEFALPAAAHDITVDEEHLYLYGAEIGVQIVDVSRPTVPVLLGSVTTALQPSRLVIDGSIGLLANFTSLVLLELSDPAHPRSLGTFDLEGWIRGVGVGETCIVVAADWHGLQTAGLRDAALPTPLARVATPVEITDVELHDEFALLASRGSGLLIADVSNPIAPRLINERDGTGRPVDAVAHGALAFVAGRDGLRVVDVSNPRLPHTIGTTTLPGHAQAVDVLDQGADDGRSPVFVAAGWAGLVVVDARDPASPAVIARLGTGHDARELCALGDGHVVVATGSGGIEIIDVADPAAPVRVAPLQLPGTALHVAAGDRYVYVAAGHAGIHVVDARDPGHPRRVGTVATPGRASRLALDEPLLYVADGRAGMQIVDVRDPEHPRVIGGIDTPEDAVGVAVNAVAAFVADGWGGLLVMPRQCTVD